MTNISHPDVKTTWKFFPSDVLFSNTNYFGSSKILRVTFFGDTWYTAHTVSFKALLCGAIPFTTLIFSEQWSKIVYFS